MYNKVYEAIYKYLKELFSYVESDFSTKVDIEVRSSDDSTGLLIQKIGSDPISQSYINGDKELLFKLSIKSFQNYIADDNDYQIKLVQFLDDLARMIEKEFEKGNKPIVDNFTVESFRQITSSSMIEVTADRMSISVIDIEFEYLKKFIF